MIEIRLHIGKQDLGCPKQVAIGLNEGCNLACVSCESFDEPVCSWPAQTEEILKAVSLDLHFAEIALNDECNQIQSMVIMLS